MLQITSRAVPTGAVPTGAVPNRCSTNAAWILLTGCDDGDDGTVDQFPVGFVHLFHAGHFVPGVDQNAGKFPVRNFGKTRVCFLVPHVNEGGACPTI